MKSIADDPILDRVIADARTRARQARSIEPGHGFLREIGNDVSCLADVVELYRGHVRALEADLRQARGELCGSEQDDEDSFLAKIDKVDFTILPKDKLDELGRRLNAERLQELNRPKTMKGPFLPCPRCGR